MEKPIMFSFTKLDRIRNEKGLSINEFVFKVKAQGLIDFSRQAYSNYKKGGQPRINTAVAMAKALDCQVEQFIL